MPFLPYTDLAEERARLKKSSEGAEYTEEMLKLATLHRLEIRTDEAAREVGVGRGIHETLHFPSLALLGKEELALLAEDVSFLLAKRVQKIGGARILAVGLGNAALTADALGVRAVEEIGATAHLAEEKSMLFKALGCAALATLTPSVTERSGMQSAVTVKAVADAFSADAVLTVDALAARSYARIGRTLEITDGVTPGSGGPLPHPRLDAASLGRPVISVGFPTVADAAALIYELLPEARESPDFSAARSGLLVSPQNTDILVERGAALISEAINRAFGVGEG